MTSLIDHIKKSLKELKEAQSRNGMEGTDSDIYGLAIDELQSILTLVEREMEGVKQWVEWVDYDNPNPEGFKILYSSKQIKQVIAIAEGTGRDWLLLPLQPTKKETTE